MATYVSQEAYLKQYLGLRPLLVLDPASQKQPRPPLAGMAVGTFLAGSAQRSVGIEVIDVLELVQGHRIERRYKGNVLGPDHPFGKFPVFFHMRSRVVKNHQPRALGSQPGVERSQPVTDQLLDFASRIPSMARRASRQHLVARKDRRSFPDRTPPPEMAAPQCLRDTSNPPRRPGNASRDPRRLQTRSYRFRLPLLYAWLYVRISALGVARFG